MKLNFLTILASSNIDDIRNADVYIVTVPTPISDKANLEPIFSASKLVGKVISDGNVVMNRLFIQVQLKRIVFL